MPDEHKKSRYPLRLAPETWAELSKQAGDVNASTVIETALLEHLKASGPLRTQLLSAALDAARVAMELSKTVALPEDGRRQGKRADRARAEADDLLAKAKELVTLLRKF